MGGTVRAERKEEEFLTISDVQRRVRMSRAWLYDKAHSGELKSYRFGWAVRFKPADVAEFIEAQRRQPAK